MKIPVTCDAERRLNYLPVAKLLEFQGDLKELDQAGYVALRDSIAEHGFFAPVFYWLDSTDADAEPKILDGHQRLRVVRGEGWTLDHVAGFGEDHVPVVDILAPSEEAAAKILLQLTGMHGKLSDEGLYAFMQDKRLKLEALAAAELPGLDLEKFADKFLNPDKPKPEPGQVPLSPELHERHDYIVFVFDNEFDWQVCSQFFDLGAVTQRPMGGSSIERKGIGRIVDGTVLAAMCGAQTTAPAVEPDEADG